MATLNDILNDKTKPDDQKIVIDDVETTLGELRKGFLFQSDYTRKTMQLSEERKRLDTERVEREAAYSEAEEKLNNLAKQIITNNPGATKNELETAIEADPVYQRLHSQLSDMTKSHSAIMDQLKKVTENQERQELSRMEDQHRQMLRALKDKDPDLNEEELINYATTYRIPRLDVAYRSMKFETVTESARKAGREEGLKEGLEKGKAQLNQPIIPSRRVLNPLPDAPKTFDEAMDAALKDPEILNTMQAGGLL